VLVHSLLLPSLSLTVETRIGLLYRVVQLADMELPCSVIGQVGILGLVTRSVRIGYLPAVNNDNAVCDPILLYSFFYILY
jgi:hypothetical protein